MNHEAVHWLGHASFRIDDAGRRIYIDPWKLPAGCPAADVILLTHSHYDHCSAADITAIRRPDTIVLAPADAAAKAGGRVTVVRPNTGYDAGPWAVHTTPAYNLGKDFHPKQNGWVGYLITLSDGRVVYHSGDTDAIPDMRTVTADIALLPCGGTYTMNGSEAGAMANIFRPGLLIPMHWGDIVGSKADAEMCRNTFTGTTVILTPER